MTSSNIVINVLMMTSIEMILWFCLIIIVCLCIILSIAYLTLFERKILAVIQRRQGPNKQGIFGLLQPLLDAFKLILKELNFPFRISLILFLCGPMVMLFLNLIGWAIIVLDFDWVLTDLNLGMFYVICVMALNIYGFISSGWASNSKYSLLGSLRATAQMLSYELTITTILLLIIFWAASLNINLIIMAQEKIHFIGCWPLFILFYCGCLAETARVPFDLPEAESELVAGYNVEYSSITFAFFFLAEYGNIILNSNLIIYFFFSGLSLKFKVLLLTGGFFSFLIKLIIILYMFIIIRATLPRFRFDQLMTLGWVVLLPLALVCSIISIIFICNSLDYMCLGSNIEYIRNCICF